MQPAEAALRAVAAAEDVWQAALDEAGAAMDEAKIARDAAYQAAEGLRQEAEAARDDGYLDIYEATGGVQSKVPDVMAKLLRAHRERCREVHGL